MKQALLFCLIITTLFSCSQKKPADKPLVIGTNMWIGYEPLHLAWHKNWFSKETVLLTEFTSNTQVIEALENKTIDFMAYSYLTDGGGVRFREAINRREIKGLLIQDYVNHAADKNTTLDKLPKLFEEGKLENLSMIINENVRVTELK